MKKLLIITVDTNDGDYNMASSEVTDTELEILIPLFKKISSFKPYKSKYMNYHNWPTGECFREDLGEKFPTDIYDITEELVEFFEDFLPSCEHGFHSIKDIKVIEVSKEIKYL